MTQRSSYASRPFVFCSHISRKEEIKSRKPATQGIHASASNTHLFLQTVEVAVQADDLIKVPQLVAKVAGPAMESVDGFRLLYATLTISEMSELEKVAGLQPVDDSTRLSRVVALTGYSDPLYAEAAVLVHQYDIVLGLPLC